MIDRLRELTREIDLERLEAVLNALRRGRDGATPDLGERN